MTTVYSGFLTRLSERLPVLLEWRPDAQSLDADLVERALRHHGIDFHWRWLDEPGLQDLIDGHSIDEALIHNAHRSLTVNGSAIPEDIFDYQDLILFSEDRLTVYHHQGRALTVQLTEFAPAVIHFYSVDDRYGEFSNFSNHPIKLKGKTWPTTEHYFQAQKFAVSPAEESVRRAGSAMEAARLGRNRKWPLRKDWESVKRVIMAEALRAKFTQYPELKALLLSTGAASLVERTVNDRYWGDGGDGSGQNWLGRLLMALRADLQKSENIEKSQ